VKRLREWVSAGGTLVALGEASRWLTREKVGLLDTKTSCATGARAEPGATRRRTRRSAREGEGRQAEPFDLEKAVQPERERPDACRAILRVTLDPEHWLSAGTDGRSSDRREPRVFTPVKLDKGTNVGVYARKDAVVESGLVWDDVRDRLAQKAFLMHQPLAGPRDRLRGGPELPGYAEATELVFMNAVLLGPAY